MFNGVKILFDGKVIGEVIDFQFSDKKYGKIYSLPNRNFDFNKAVELRSFPIFNMRLINFW